MKFLNSILVITLMGYSIIASAQSAGKGTKQDKSSADKIEAYYFHFTARCNTCKTIEAQTKEDLEALYPDLVKSGFITFQSLNLDEPSTKPIADGFGISGQTLILVRGDQKINLTNEGFMYAVVKPGKFKEIINEKVNDLLSR